METAYIPVMEQTEPMTAQQEIDWTRAGQMLYAEAGVTTAHAGVTHLPQSQTMKRASDAGANIIDVIAYPFITDLDKVLAEFPVAGWVRYQSRFKVGGVKITRDGSPQGRTAFFTTPYLEGGPSGEKNWKGEPTFPQDIASKMVKKVYDLNDPMILHCNGDACIDAFLTAYESARTGDFSRPWNVTTIHTQIIRKDQIPAFVKYKSRPSFYTLHTFYFADAHVRNRGPEQASYISPMRDAIDAGLRPTNHTDFVGALLDQHEKEAASYPSWKGMMGPRGKVDEETRPVAAAAAWGLNPDWDATYLNYNGGLDASVCRKATYEVPENKAFWSITVYGADGFMKTDRNIVNSSNVKLNPDGTFTVYFGSEAQCGNQHDRVDVTDGWNFLMRIYRPGASVLNGAYKLPDPRPAG